VVIGHEQVTFHLKDEGTSRMLIVQIPKCYDFDTEKRQYIMPEDNDPDDQFSNETFFVAPVKQEDLDIIYQVAGPTSS
jgi:hypothetical protein